MDTPDGYVPYWIVANSRVLGNGFRRVFIRDDGKAVLRVILTGKTKSKRLLRIEWDQAKKVQDVGQPLAEVHAALYPHKLKTCSGPSCPI